MNKFTPFCWDCPRGAGSSIAAAQQTASMPKVLQITREFISLTSPARRTTDESAFITAMTKAKFPPITSPGFALRQVPRLVPHGYDSFADWEKDNTLVDRTGARGRVGARKYCGWRAAG